MSKAFTKDDDHGAEPLIAPRAPLPAGSPNYVTQRGLRALHDELRRLEQERAVANTTDTVERPFQLQTMTQRLAELQARIASAQTVDPSLQPHDQVRFGATVRVRSASGTEQSYQIVGVDEADASCGKIAFSSPLARALLGKRLGDSALLSTPRASEELEVVGIVYDDAA